MSGLGKVTHSELKTYLADNLITMSQAADLLGISKQMLSLYVKSGQLSPVFQSSQGKLFYKRDVEEILFKAKHYLDCPLIAQNVAKRIQKTK